MNSSIFGIGGEKRQIEEDSREYVALEQALMKIAGVGEVALYFHYAHAEEAKSVVRLLLPFIEASRKQVGSFTRSPRDRRRGRKSKNSK